MDDDLGIMIHFFLSLCFYFFKISMGKRIDGQVAYCGAFEA